MSTLFAQDEVDQDDYESYRDAVLSRCGTYRYSLTRTWNDRKPGVLFIMLNPSVADAKQDDPTIRRCLGYAKAWGCGSLCVVNLFAYRATSPANLITVARQDIHKAIGPDNDEHIRLCVYEYTHPGDYLIAAWGANASHPALKPHCKEVMQFLPLADLMCLATTDKGDPRHPLYCRSSLNPTLFEDKDKTKCL